MAGTLRVLPHQGGDAGQERQDEGDAAFHITRVPAAQRLYNDPRNGDEQGADPGRPVPAVHPGQAQQEQAVDDAAQNAQDFPQ